MSNRTHEIRMSKLKILANQNKRTDPGPSESNKTATTPCDRCTVENNSTGSRFVLYLQLLTAFILVVGLMSGSIALVSKLWGSL